MKTEDLAGRESRGLLRIEMAGISEEITINVRNECEKIRRRGDKEDYTTISSREPQFSL